MPSPREVVLAWVDAFNRRDAETAAALHHDDATNLQVAIGQPLVGCAAILEDVRAFFRAFPDRFTKVEGLLEDGEWVALEWSGGASVVINNDDLDSPYIVEPARVVTP